MPSGDDWLALTSRERQAVLLQAVIFALVGSSAEKGRISAGRGFAPQPPIEALAVESALRTP